MGIGVTLLVVILVIILVYVTFKTRLSQNRFKLLDNSDNISSYQSVSPADTILPAASSTIPLQRYNIPSSSSSSSPAGKSPSTNSTSSLVHPSVARSLRNIKQSASKQDIQHIELDLNSRLF